MSAYYYGELTRLLSRMNHQVETPRYLDPPIPPSRRHLAGLSTPGALPDVFGAFSVRFESWENMDGKAREMVIFMEFNGFNGWLVVYLPL